MIAHMKVNGFSTNSLKSTFFVSLKCTLFYLCRQLRNMTEVDGIILVTFMKEVEKMVKRVARGQRRHSPPPGYITSTEGVTVGYASLLPLKRATLERFIHDEIQIVYITPEDTETFTPAKPLALQSI